MTKILITGGAGYIGSNVTNLLIDNGFEVTVIDNLITGNKNLINKKATFVNCDIADQKIINTLLSKDKYTDEASTSIVAMKISNLSK